VTPRIATALALPFIILAAIAVVALVGLGLLLGWMLEGRRHA
jgi:Na+/citrate or Na+/malate symporter